MKLLLSFSLPIFSFDGGVSELIGIGFGVVVFIAACVWWNHMMNKD